MGFVFTWQREQYIEQEELIAAIEETGRALSLSFVARSVSQDDATDEDDDPAGSRVILRRENEVDDDLTLAIGGPVPIRASTTFTGYTLQMFESTVDADWVPAYLFMLHVATLLGMVQEDSLDLDDSDELSEEEQHARRLATTEPAADPEHGGASVLRVWVDGIAGPARPLTMSDRIDEVDIPEDAVCDLVHYLPNGQPMLRRATLTTSLDEPVKDLFLIPTWCWAPAVTGVQRAFEEITRDARARFVPPPPQPPVEGLTLERWLEAFSHITGRLSGVKASDLVAADRRDQALLPEGLRPGTPVGARRIPAFLTALEAVISHGDHEWSAHAGLLLSGEWANDSTDRFVDGLVAMLGLPEPPVSAEPAPYDAYLATLNAAAESLGKEERLYVVPNELGVTLVIKLRPRVFDELKVRGLIDAHLPSGPGVARTGAWRQLTSWWSKRFS